MSSVRKYTTKVMDDIDLAKSRDAAGDLSCIAYDLVNKLIVADSENTKLKDKINSLCNAFLSSDPSSHVDLATDLSNLIIELKVLAKWTNQNTSLKSY